MTSVEMSRTAIRLPKAPSSSMTHALWPFAFLALYDGSGRRRSAMLGVRPHLLVAVARHSDDIAIRGAHEEPSQAMTES
jgi:hypothetical protein